MEMLNNQETVLVTGGTGFLAGWCITKLLEQGYSVRTTIRSLSKEEKVRKNVLKNDARGDRLSFYTTDLTSDEGWDEAVQGCDYVLHVASPLGVENPKDPDVLIIPAREGTLRVLKAAVKAGVKRVVMTSSCAAATPSKANQSQNIDESCWSDPNSKELDAYRKSKVLAEMAAWEYMKEAGSSMRLVTILPGSIFGPTLSKDNRGSLQIIERMALGKTPGNPKIGFEVVDVRDLADLHILAMKSPGAAGQRFIATAEYMLMSDIAKLLRGNLKELPYKISTREIPDLLIRILSPFDQGIKSLVPMLGRRFYRTSAKARQVLGWQPRPASETILASTESILSGGKK